MKISILGCGWLGKELAKKLIAEMHEVRGSVTSMEKMAELRKDGILPYQLKLYEKGVQGDLRSFLSGCEVLVISVPPGLRSHPEINYVRKIRNLLPYIENNAPKKIIYTSSTSVYPDTENFPVYTEESETDNSSDKAIQLHNAELLFLNNQKLNTTVLRFGGLIGGGRHPVKFLSGRKGIQNPEAPVNLVHRDDCIAAIQSVLKNKGKTSVYNLVYPEHPSKEEYYTSIARKKNLQLPEFDHSATSKGKIISSEKIQKELKFKFNTSIH
ncbi:NAD(P)-dependent oxidoreductase [Christiangramia fulva]|uniref:NAD(P)-dependent oxidoreductase n=1 Tax=Christiangramia fulva TaxID=2126553 RepID=A0A2R3Z420_9FLAO|nr:SDR family oxidoreductase [Christiangramia fulva]AVR45001.1 NAD(P)-dependent oxidoreductase [Christiangramia fulva]